MKELDPTQSAPDGRKLSVSNIVSSFLGLLNATDKVPNVKAVVDWVTTNVQGVPFGGSIVPTSTPTGTGATSWIATQAGTYANFGGVVVTANSLAVISRTAAGVFSISQTALDLTNYLQVSSVVNNLNSTSATSPLSANQGKILGEKIKIDETQLTYTFGFAQVLNGAVAITNGFSVPIGQTGNNTFLLINKVPSGYDSTNFVGREIKVIMTFVITNFSQLSNIDNNKFAMGRFQGANQIADTLPFDNVTFVDLDSGTTKTRTITGVYNMTQADIDNGYWYKFTYQLINTIAVSSVVTVTLSNLNVSVSNSINRLINDNKDRLDNIESQVYINASDINVIKSSADLGVFSVPSIFSQGQQLNGAVAITNGFSIPIGQTGRFSYFRIIPSNLNYVSSYFVGQKITFIVSIAITNYASLSAIPALKLERLQGTTQISTNAPFDSLSFVDVDSGTTRTRTITGVYNIKQSDIDNGYNYRTTFQIDNLNLVSSVVNFTLESSTFTLNKSLFGEIEALEANIIALENKDVNITNVKNGTPIVYGNVSNFTGLAISNRDIVNDSLVFNRVGAGNSWILTPVFVPLGSNLVHIKFKTEFTKVGTTKGIQLVVAQGTGVGTKFLNLGSPIRENGDYDITFDPAYYNVYEGYTNFYVWINNENILAGESFTCKLTGLKVFEYKDTVKSSNIEGENVKELFESTDNQLTSIKSEVGNSPVFISPLGNKFELNVSNTGVLSTVPVIPTKAAYFGNSLIGGFGYGMAASEAQFDYYNRINNYITSISPGFTFYKASGSSAFEGATTEGQLVTAINTMIASLAGNETLVCIQLGDNVNTVEKNAIFNGGGCLRLLQAVRAKCPSAKVVWMGMWYGSAERYDTIDKSCRATGSKFISFSDLISNESRNAIGNISKIGTATRTLSSVTSVVANTPTNITVNFTVSSVAYSTTLDVTSYSLASGVLTYTGLYEIISNSGVASHPSDEGFRRISNKFLYEMKLTDDPEYYK